MDKVAISKAYFKAGKTAREAFQTVQRGWENTLKMTNLTKAE